VNPHFQRGQLLIEQGRHSMAEDELRQALIQEPSSPLIHATLAVAMVGQEKLEGALEEARTAIAHGPDVGFAHYVHAVVLRHLKMFPQALESIEEAIRLTPGDADYWSLLAGLYVAQEQWVKALEAADMGLQFDPGHEGCVNLRAMALVRLNRRDEAGQAVEGALERDPGSALSHANMGWTLLHQNNPDKAMEHFREALRLEPTLEWARAGIVEALKARNVVYRVFLMYALWLGRLSPTVRWGVIIGLVVLMQVISRVPTTGALAVAAMVAILVYFAFVLTVWTAEPLFNLLLRFDRMGRLVLSDSERRDTNWMALAMLVIAAFVGSAIWEGHYSQTIYYLMLGVPLGVALNVSRNGRRALAGAVTAGLFVVAGIYWYGWFSWAWPFDPYDIDAANRYVNEYQDVLDKVQKAYDQQGMYQKIVMWGSVAMSWIAPMFDRK
jgi:tetratricopeptide (TPR) repeat protein